MIPFLAFIDIEKDKKRATSAMLIVHQYRQTRLRRYGGGGGGSHQTAEQGHMGPNPPTIPATDSGQTVVQSSSTEPENIGRSEKQLRGTPPAGQSDDAVKWVTWKGDDDPEHPINWSTRYKAWTLLQVNFLALSLLYASSISASTETGIKAEFRCGQVAATSTTGVFLIGMGVGAMPAASLSELYGRVPVYLISLLVATLFEIGCAVSQNIGALIVLRFFAGVFSSAPISNAGGSLSDLGSPVARGFTLPIFTCVGFLGPDLGPLISGFVVQDLGWRWAYWISAIWSGASFVWSFFCMPETNPEAILRIQAIRLRRVTKDASFKAEIESRKTAEALAEALTRPFVMLATEPIVQLFSLYLSVVYVVLFGSFTAYPAIFVRPHDLTPAQTGLMFLPQIVGFFLLLCLQIPFALHYRTLARQAEQGLSGRMIEGRRVAPEQRLVIMMLCCLLFPSGLFWLAWTSPSRYSYWLTTMSGLPYAVGLLCIFQGAYAYMIDAYGAHASSALAASTLVRYGVSGFIVLAFPAMYTNLGNEWATSLLAFLALALSPVPFFFFFYGQRVRAKCKHTAKDQ